MVEHHLTGDAFFSNGLVLYKILIGKRLCSGHLLTRDTFSRSQLNIPVQENLFWRTVQNDNTVQIH